MSHRWLQPIKDQYMRGFFAGLIAGIVKDLPDLFLVDIFKIKQLAFWDYVGVMMFNKLPSSFLDHFLAFCIQVAFSLGLGIIYSIVIIRKFPTKYYLVGGLIYGSSCWFVLISIVKLFNISQLLSHDLFTPIATLAFSAGYGLLLAFLNNYYTPKVSKIN